MSSPDRPSFLARIRSRFLRAGFLAGWISLHAVNSASGETLWSEKFDDAGAAARWSAEGDWGIGAATAGPGAAVSASGVAATSLAGTVTPSASRRISVASGIAIPATSSSPRLRFRQWYHFSPGSRGRVQVRTGQSQWTDLGGGPIDNRSSGWDWVCLPLDGYVGATIEIGFLCETGAEAPAPGWYLDDLEVIVGPESDYAAWLAAYFAGAYPNPEYEANLWKDEADSDKDGCPNLLEFVMHRNPVVSDAHLGPTPRIDGADLVIRFRVTSSAVHDVSWLGFWSNSFGQWLPGGIRYEPVEGKPGHQIIDARISRNREARIFFFVEAWRN